MNGISLRELPELPATEAEFWSWVDKHDDDAVLGVASDPNDCPIAHFIADEETLAYVDKPTIVVTSIYPSGVERERTYRTPLWVDAVVDAVDSQDDEDVFHPPILAGWLRRHFEHTRELPHAQPAGDL